MGSSVSRGPIVPHWTTSKILEDDSSYMKGKGERECWNLKTNIGDTPEFRA